MNSTINLPGVPENEAGKALDIECIVKEDLFQEAMNTFDIARSRLLHPSLWQQLAGTGTASFSVSSANSDKIEPQVHANDFLRIDIPGPGPVAGEGFDWVKVEEIQENRLPDADASFVMRLRACANPHHPGEGTAHFFTEEATSTFILKRNGDTVTLSYHGRNEKPNTSNVNTMDKIRNALVGGSAIAGLSEIQWKALLQGILKRDKET